MQGYHIVHHCQFGHIGSRHQLVKDISEFSHRLESGNGMFRAEGLRHFKNHSSDLFRIRRLPAHCDPSCATRILGKICHFSKKNILQSWSQKKCVWDSSEIETSSDSGTTKKNVRIFFSRFVLGENKTSASENSLFCASFQMKLQPMKNHFAVRVFKWNFGQWEIISLCEFSNKTSANEKSFCCASFQIKRQPVKNHFAVRVLK